MRLRLFAVVFLILGLGCFCFGGDDTDDSAPPADSWIDTGIPGGDFWEEYATALCEHFEGCLTPEDFKLAYGTMEECVDQFITDFVATAEESFRGCTFNESYGRACIDGVEAGPCEGFEMPLPCQNLFYCDTGGED